jgi:uncharacterized Zn-finger protein
MARGTGGFVHAVSDYGQGIGARVVAGTIAADAATLTDAFIAPTLAISCQQYDTIFVTAEIAGGTAPSVTVEPLFYDKEAADGSRWKRLMVGALPGVPSTVASVQSAVLVNNATMVEMQTFGHPKVFLRVSAVANAPATTGYTVVAMPGRVRPNFDKLK